jgi:peptidoglycan/xylan/chitin deacetylase (PgdA/CDA1 family)
VTHGLSQRRRRAIVRRRRAVALLVLALALIGILAVTGSTAGPKQAARRLPTRAVPRPTPRSSQEALAVEGVRRRMPFITAGGGRVREIALTFDDGPGPYTPELIATLRRLRTPATFFAVGQSMTDFHGATSSELRERFVIGDHTQNHAYLARLSELDQHAQIVVGAESLGTYGVPPPTLFRPPYRSFNSVTLKILRELHLLMVLWSVDTQDYLRPGVAAIVRRALSGARPGAIVLMHDGGGIRTQTIAALPFIVRALHRRGFRLVTVPRLLLDDPPRRPQRLPPAGRG